LILPIIFFSVLLFFSTWLLLPKTFKALNGLLCADVPLRNYSLTYVICLWHMSLQRWVSML